MGRYVSQSVSTQPRRKIVRLTASNPSLAIPSWAKVLRVSGCGGGASGAVAAINATTMGSGGGAGAFAHDVCLALPTGVLTLAAIIGAAGAAVASTNGSSGNAGGATTLAIAGLPTLTLEGGKAGNAGGTSVFGGQAYFGASKFNTGLTFNDMLAAAGLQAGKPGGGGSQPNEGYGEGACSAFGDGGLGRASPASDVNGNNASGYGAGGSGGNCFSGASKTSGAGSPGLLILEFLEAL